MKRINPITNKPFKYKDTREDGFIFWAYRPTKNLNGFFGERWLCPEKFLRYENETRVRHKKRSARQRKTPSGRAINLLGGAQRRCKERKLGVVTITREWIEDKLSQGFCELTKIPFDFEPPKDKNVTNPYAPSLDKIDSANPDYTPENTRVVLVGVNLALNTYGLDAMMPIFKKLAEL